jgi:hypothetical protein
MFAYSHKYYATNAQLGARSPQFEAREAAIAWAADAAQQAGYHSKIYCAATTHIKDDGRELETVSTEVGAVMPGSRQMLERLNSRTVGYPSW